MNVTADALSDKIRDRMEIIQSRGPLLETALSFHDPKRKAETSNMSAPERIMYDNVENCKRAVWRTWKFFHYRSCLDWGTDPSKVCAKLLGFPQPDPSLEAGPPGWWKGFRKFMDNHVSRVRGRACYDIGKKMKGEPKKREYSE